MGQLRGKYFHVMTSSCMPVILTVYVDQPSVSLKDTLNSLSVDDITDVSFKVAEDDIAFKLTIFKKSLHLNDNTCFCSIIQASKLVFGSLLAKNNFFVQFWTKNFASSRMADCGRGLPAEWPFRSQNAIEASDSPLPGGLWVKRLITHAWCSLAYSDIAWCKLFLILTMKGLY